MLVVCPYCMTILDRGQFKVQGGYDRFNKLFGGKLEAVLGDLHQWFHRQVDQPCRHPAAIKQVTPVDYEIDLFLQGRLQRSFEVGEEVVAPPSTRDPRAGWEVETQMRVGDEQDAGGLIYGGFWRFRERRAVS